MSKTINHNGVNTSIANVAMLQFAENYAKANWYLEGWVKPEDFWANKMEAYLHPEKPQVIRINYVAPVFDDEKEAMGHWEIPRVEIDSYWGHPRISVVDREGNFCCVSYDRETNEFKEGQFWKKNGLNLAHTVKTAIEAIIKRLEVEYGA